ncbi:peptidase family m20 m25 m40 protein [Stagonosporopsis vannaccii]|nr:peptidase family m20 m25 m40 protein [Stagonosporopsis vannaccii]
MAPDDSHSLRNLAPQSSNSRWRFTRSTANLREPSSLSISGPSSSQNASSKLSRAPSKLSLFNLFSRPKVEKARGHTEVGLAVPMRPQTPPKPSVPPKSALRHNPSPAAQQSIRSRSSQIFRPMSMKPPPPDSETSIWEPPPLFQAFPQSVKHATLRACTFPPEVLMRTQSQRRQAESIRERIDTARDLSVIEENSTETKKLEKSHKRLISNSVLNPPAPELVDKIYILVTAGYVLQYAGHGPFDRAPEKVLKLGKDSAAFACDLIPGKHWVLQISSHAHDDGTIEMGPKSSLLSRLRTQNAIGRKAATSFLLILESAEEMDAWMTAVRKEIENNGGQRAKDEPTRASSSIDGSSGKQSIETSHRYLVQRDPNIITKIAPVVDSPHSSYHAIPLKVSTSDWETERTPSVASSYRDRSSRRSITRQSAEISSASSTPISQDQMQLDQLRGRSRFSYMSNATSASGTGTRNTSRDTSPTPQSPLKEISSPVWETESHRPFRSLHSNPSNDTGSRRRSVQPLPITTEDSTTSVEVPATRQRHSSYGPASPTFQDLAKTEPEVSLPVVVAAASAPPPPSPFVAAKGLTAHIASQARSADEGDASSASNQREDSPVRFNIGSYGALSRERTISPPPRESAPAPPRSAYRQSLSQSASYTTQNPSSLAPFKSNAARQSRISATPKPFLRPFPVRPQAQHANSTNPVQRRASALPSVSPSLSTLAANRSVTAPPRSDSTAAVTSPSSHASPLHSLQAQTLRRPTSVQVRADPAPFLASIRPSIAISSTPSFVPGTGRKSPPAARVLHSSPSTGTLRQETSLQAPTPPKLLMQRKSMPAMGLPPPAPPPDMPLPAPPPNMPLPAPPPTMPLPAPPTNARQSLII